MSEPDYSDQLPDYVRANDLETLGTERIRLSGEYSYYWVAEIFQEIIDNWPWYTGKRDEEDEERFRCGVCHIGLYQESYLAQLGHLYNYHKYNRDGTVRTK